MQVIEKIKSWIVVDQVENRLFLIALIFAIPYFGSSMLFDYLNNAPLLFTVLDMILLAVCLLMLYLSRKKRLLPYFIHFFCFLIILGGAFYWVISGGVASGGSYVFTVVIVLVILMSNKKLQLIFTALIVVLIFGLLSFDFESPVDIVYPHLMFDYVLNIVILTILLSLFRLAMDQEQKNLEGQYLEISELNESLNQKSKELEQYNLEIKTLQENLEEIVKQRSEQLEEENRLDLEYAFINAHLIRAPIANIMGLIEIVEDSNSEKITQLKNNITDLDQVVRKIGKVLSEG